MATVQIELDVRNTYQSKKKEENTEKKFPLKLRIFHQGLYRDIPLNIKLRPTDWSVGKMIISGKEENSKRLRLSIMRKYSIATAVLADYDHLIKKMNVEDVRDFVNKEIEKQLQPSTVDATYLESIKMTPPKGKEHSMYLEKCGEQLIKRKNEAKDFGTAKWYRDAMNAFKKFNNNKDIKLVDITITFLEDFAAHHKRIGNTNNGVAPYYRAIRAITNTVIREQLNRKNFETYPWGRGGFKIKTNDTKKRAAEKDVIGSIRNLEIEKASALWNARNYFLWMFNTRGMNLIDVAKFRKKDVKNAIYANGKLKSGSFEYQRSKTGKPVTVRLTGEAVDVLNQYRIFEKHSEEFVFPIGFEDSETGYATYRQKRKRINACFKELAEQAEFPDLNLTTYVVRHSWSTIAKKVVGASTDLISEALVHSNKVVTEDYLEGFDNEEIDTLNDNVVNASVIQKTRPGTRRD